VAYTGDLRLHGSRGELTRRFVQELGALKPTVLLCEGTRADQEGGGGRSYTEQDVREHALREVREAQGLVIADFGPRNVERLVIFADIARETDRALVILPKDAYLLKAANLADPSIPSVMDRPDLYVYDEPKLRVDRWERTVREECEGRMVSPAQIHQRQDQYILCFSFYDLDELPTIRPRPGSLYLYSSHEAFNEELQLDFRRLSAWIDHFGMRGVGLPREELDWDVPEEEKGLHASGHASGEDIMAFVKEIGPRTVVPIHTENPGYFREHLRDTDVEVRILEYGESLTFG
jgi:ribonuclease J